ncbi:undecaprenyl diphosphate synthase [Bacilli bacterium PM5-3]|nr:undecaprenyl diphosphate synthase [Bacilli bacterium PM5-3]MDH6603147.1 undecaprenyl diphosphate synthase [Bacilli bacterium PM5-9]
MKKKELNHLAIILDGNGRWAQQRNMPRVKGHYEGGKKVKEIAIAASLKGIKRMSVFAFSTENWARPTSEVDFIFKLPKVFLDMYLSDLMKYQIRIDYIGDLENIPKNAKKSIEDSINKTKNNTGMVLCFALNYGAQDEILKATKKISEQVINNTINIDDINIELFEENLMNATPVDLLIRTSGEQRISNFLLWQIAYSEIYFTNVLWPDFDEEQLDIALDNYYKRDRRFGGIKDEN